MPANLLEGTLIGQQLDNELNAIARGVERYRRMCRDATERGEGAALRPAERLLAGWHQSLTEAIGHEKKHIMAGRAGIGRSIYGPALLSLQSKKLAVITMHCLLSDCMREPNGPNVPRLAEAIGKAVNAEAMMPRVRKEKTQLNKVTKTTKVTRPKHVLRAARKIDSTWFWSRSTHTHLGMCLIHLTINVAAADPEGEKPAFERKLQMVRGKRLWTVKLAHECRTAIEDGHTIREHLRPRYVPMVCRPLLWSGTTRGGYVKLKAQIVKRACRLQRERMEGTNLDAMYEGVNAINQVPWSINQQALQDIEVMAEVGAAGLPSPCDRSLPPRPHDIATNIEAKRLWKRAAARVHRENAKASSARINSSLRLQIAQDFKEYEEIYFPHQGDTRGRMYTLPMYLNHQGDDASRALLQFAHAKELGEEGWKWLLIHGANCFGIDKCTLKERQAWAENSIPDMERCIADPMAYPMWKTADKPMQFLAACREIVAAKKSPHNYKSKLPVQLDGTANGLQHYACLGRDAVGAAQVNLIPGEKPADIYAAIAAMVSEIVDRHAQTQSIAAKLQGKVSRSVCKPPVMTAVYGVTMVGARIQVQEKLAAAGIATEDAYPAAIYLSRVILECMAKMCSKATAIMAWMKTCARAIVAKGHVVTWTSPIGLPIVQDYRVTRTSRIVTMLQRVDLQRCSDNLPPSPRKQINAFPPNFIHGVDVSHMLAVASKCAAVSIDMAAVHDSFWTHAADAGKMSSIIRDEMVSLHSRPLLQQLYLELQTNHDITLPEPPPVGEMDLEQIRESIYAFS